MHIVLRSNNDSRRDHNYVLSQSAELQIMVHCATAASMDCVYAVSLDYCAAIRAMQSHAMHCLACDQCCCVRNQDL